MKLTETPAWKSDPATARLDHEHLRDLGKQFKTASSKRNGGALEQILNQLREFFQAINFLKRTPRSVWFGRPCLQLPPKDIQRIDCPIKGGDYELVKRLRDLRLQALDQDVAQGQNTAVLDTKLMSMTYAVRICAAFPGLIRLAERNNIALEKIATTRDRMKEQGILPQPENSKWADQIDTLLQGSTRWEYIQGLINRLGVEPDTNAPHKLVILSQFPTVAVIVFLVRLLLHSPRSVEVKLTLPGTSQALPGPPPPPDWERAGRL